VSLQENRVRITDYGTIDRGDPRLVLVATVDGRAPQHLHWAAAAAFDRMRAAARGAGYDLRLASGWRPHRWRSRAAYEAHLLKKYGTVKTGRKWLAFASPHETGLAFDLGTHGLAPVSATAERQRQRPVYKWLANNAHRFGITPYLPEPWHWEVKIPRAKWEQRAAVNGIGLIALSAILGMLLVGWYLAG
jgi:LAS superfamily LD-carboxypeptidase LdcB